MSKRVTISPDDVTQHVLASAKYGNIDSSLVHTVSLLETPKASREPEAIKRVKRKLHQMVGAYLDSEMPFDAWIERLSSVDEATRLNVCREILAYHASTRERLPEMEEFFDAAFEGIQSPKIIADLACGLNPLARPFMPLPPDTLYRAYDVHLGLVSFVQDALLLMGYRAEAYSWNLLVDQPLPTADVALLLKTLPCLDQAIQATSQRLLERLDAPLVVVSFPTVSLGGARRGMEQFYEKRFLRIVPQDLFVVETRRFRSELMFRLWRRASQTRPSIGLKPE